MFRKTAMVLLGLLCLSFCKAQGFNYTFSTQAGVYADLPTATEFWQNYEWDADEMEVPLGFSFSFNGTAYDALTIQTDGTMAFGSFDNSLVVFGSDLMCKATGVTAKSKVRYAEMGTSGSGIFVLEFLRAGFYNGDDNDEASFQVWLYESTGVIEYHYGNVQTASIPEAFEDQTGPMIGLLNYNESNSSSVSGVLTNGSTATTVSGTSRIYVNGLPANGTIFRFTPN